MHDKINVVYYINLDQRKDRDAQIREELEKYGCKNIHRIPAIHVPEKGYIGASLSHIKTIEEFLKSNHQTCIIFEDDFTFTQPIDVCKSLFDRLFHENIHWDCVMLSSNIRSYVPFNGYLDKCLDALTASGYMITRDFAPILLDDMKRGVQMLIQTDNRALYCVDIHWIHLMKASSWFVFKPKLGIQRPSFSDIEKRDVDYRV